MIASEMLCVQLVSPTSYWPSSLWLSFRLKASIVIASRRRKTIGVQPMNPTSSLAVLSMAACETEDTSRDSFPKSQYVQDTHNCFEESQGHCLVLQCSAVQRHPLWRPFRSKTTVITSIRSNVNFSEKCYFQKVFRW